jgi:hypothetical protein
MDPLTLYERDAELAYTLRDDIDKAATWCCAHYPHQFGFLNSIRTVLVAEARHYSSLGLGEAWRRGWIKPTSVLARLSPSQALRLLEAYFRATINTIEMWEARDIREMLRIRARQQRCDQLAAIKKELDND